MRSIGTERPRTQESRLQQKVPRGRCSAAPGAAARGSVFTSVQAAAKCSQQKVQDLEHASDLHVVGQRPVQSGHDELGD